MKKVQPGSLAHKVLKKASEKFFLEQTQNKLKQQQIQIFNAQNDPQKQIKLNGILDRVMVRLKKQNDKKLQQIQLESNNIRISKFISRIQDQSTQQHPNKYFTITYKFRDVSWFQNDPQFLQISKLYLSHLRQTLEYIHQQNQMHFLGKYEVLDHKDQQIVVRMDKADSDFVDNRKLSPEELFNKLDKEQQICWLWSFPQMITQMESIYVFHLDIQIRNTVKLKYIFQSIDYEYSIWTEGQSFKNLLSWKSHKKEIVFKRITSLLKDYQYSTWCETGVGKQLRQQCVRLDQLIDEQLRKKDSLQKNYETIKKLVEQLLRNFHKLSFFRVLSKAIQYTKHQQIKKNIQSIMQLLDFSSEGPKIYRQFASMLKEKYKFLSVDQTQRLKYIRDIPKQQQFSSIRQKCIDKNDVFMKEFYQKSNHKPSFIICITTDFEDRQGSSYMQVRKSFIPDFWSPRVFKARYLSQFYIQIGLALERLEISNIYFTHLEISDIVLQGQIFKIRTLENAVKITPKIQLEEMDALQQSSRSFLQYIFIEKKVQAMKYTILISVYKAGWFHHLQNKDYEKIIIELKTRRIKFLHSLMTQFLEQIQKSKQSEYVKLSPTFWELSNSLKKDLSQANEEAIKETLNNIEKTDPKQSFAGVDK